MYVRWLRSDYFDIIKDDLGLDNHIINKCLEHSPHLCFYVVGENSEFLGLICGYEFEQSVQIVSFFGDLDVKSKLLKSFLQSVHDKPIQTIIPLEDFTFLQNQGFEKYCDVLEYISSGRAVAFNFTTNHAKEVNNQSFFQIAYKLNKKILGDDMYEFASTHMNSTSSLNLATSYGYLHSRGLNKDILISPFLVEDMNYMDAEKLLRGVLHYRGLKKLRVRIPNIKEIKELFESYKFVEAGKFVFVYYGNKPNFRLDNVYGF